MSKKLKEVKVEKKLRVRKWTMLELVELDESIDYRYNDDDYDGEVELARKRSRKKVQRTFTVTDTRTGEVSRGWTKPKINAFIHALKRNEVKNFKVTMDDLPENSMEVPKREFRITGHVENHRKGSYAECVGETCEAKPKDIVAQPSTFSPELDTVRVYFDCSGVIDLDLFIPFSATKMVRLATRGVTGTIDSDFTRYRTEMKCSWYGKMQITREERMWGKNAKYHYPVLCFEYSVAKWYNFTNGINSGFEPTAELLLKPCIQAMYALHIERFSESTFNYIVKRFLEVAELRRFDLSLNFKAPKSFKVAEYVQTCARCRINRQDSKQQGDGSFSWGSEKSPYRVIVYDKETEQKLYYNRKEPGGRYTYFIDADGNTYEQQNENRSLKEITVDHNNEKKDFYFKNKHKFDNVFRFEVQFRSKFIQENNLMSQGAENIDKIIKVGVVYWRDLLNRMDEQLGRENFNYNDQKEGFAKVLDTLSNMKSSGVISRTVYNNKFSFLMQCAYNPWQTVRDDMGKDLFSQNYTWVKKNLNYDLKVSLSGSMPIMRIMPTLYLDKMSNLMYNFRLMAAPVYDIAI